MSRAHFRDIVPATTGSGGNYRALAGATVQVYQTGTTSQIAGPIYADASSGTTLSNPLTTASDGTVEFWLATDQRVDLYITAPGYSPKTVTVDVVDELTITNTTLVNPAFSGNLVLSGNAVRIQGNMSGTPIANRMLFQNNAAASTATALGVLPPAGGTNSQIVTYSGSDPDNAATFRLVCNATTASLATNSVSGTGVELTSLAFNHVNGASISIDTASRVVTFPVGIVTSGLSKFNLATAGSADTWFDRGTRTSNARLLFPVAGNTVAAGSWWLGPNSDGSGASQFEISNAGLGSPALKIPESGLVQVGTVGLQVDANITIGGTTSQVIGRAAQQFITSLTIRSNIQSTPSVATDGKGGAHLILHSGANSGAANTGDIEYITVPDGAASGDHIFQSFAAGVFTKLVQVYHTGGVYIGSTPSDPGAGKLTVASGLTVSAGGISVTGGLVCNTSSPVITNPTSGTVAAYGSFNNTGGTFYFGLDNSTGTAFGTQYAAVVWHSGAYPLLFATAATERARFDSAGVFVVASTIPTPAGGSAAARMLFGTTAGFGIYYGSGAPAISGAQGSLYLRSDGSSTSTRLYVNTNGSTGWTAVTTAT